MELGEEEKEVLRKVMAHARSFKTEATAEASRINGRKGGPHKGPRKPLSPEAIAKIQAGQAARRAREAAAKTETAEQAAK